MTLGGTGKDAGDRHPKVEDNVLIGAAATILGNITVGRGAQVAAGSLVLKPVPPRTAVAGSPAQVVGLVRGNPALRMQQWVASLDGKAAPAWESAMCPPASQPSSPQSDASSSPQPAPQRKQEEQQEEREINRRLYPRRDEEPSLPFVPVAAAAAAVEAKSPPTPTTPATTPPLPPQQPKRPSPPPPSTPSKPKQPPGKREQEPEFFI